MRSPDHPVIVLQQEGVEIPSGILDFAGFRAWVRSESFPERGRIDWVDDRMEVDMAPEDLNTHASPKSAIAVKLGVLIQDARRGMVFIDRTRLTCPEADLSAEPDVLAILLTTIRSGAVRLVSRASGEPGRYVEIEGPADLAVEVISDSSETKDGRMLRAAYERARVREYWIVDVRRPEIRFDVLIRRGGGYRRATVRPDGFRKSAVLAAEVRLVRDVERAGLVFYRLDVR